MNRPTRCRKREGTPRDNIDKRSVPGEDAARRAFPPRFPGKGASRAMDTTQSAADRTIDPELLAAVEAWTPAGGSRPEVGLEPRPEGLRVKLTYLGVESGVLFAWGARVTASSVQATLDRLFEVLSWRVIQPPAA